MFVIANNKPLKEFAVPLLCELAKSSSVTRSILFENDGLIFYLDLLRESKGTFHTDALDAIGACLQFEGGEKIEEIIMDDDNLDVMVNIFSNAGDHLIVQLLESLLTVLNSSVKINKQLGSNLGENGIVSILRGKLHHPIPNARVNLLRTLTALCKEYKEPKMFLLHNNLLKVVNFMATEDSSALVKSMAVKLLQDGSTFV